MSDKLKEFINNKNHTIDDYLKLSDEDALSYDFSNDCILNKKEYDGASDEYHKLQCDKKYAEKFFAYMLSDKDISNKVSFLFSLNNKKDMLENYCKTISCLAHPDSNSLILHDLYLKLWPKECKENAITTNNDIIFGDTLNSVNTTLRKFYEYIEDNNEKEERENILVDGKKQTVSKSYITFRFFSNKYLGESKTISEIITNNEYKCIIDLFNNYHTLGNFMPIPKDCNVPRMQGVAKDYLDITLYLIYNYYLNDDIIDGKKCGIEYLMGSMSGVFITWLKNYGAGQDGWNNFVMSNFFGDLNVNGKLQENFVELKSDGNYGMPRELWDKHFDKFKNKRVILPKAEECIEYFRNANKWIYARGLIMFDKLKSK